jgi:hypothetical protein
LTDERNVKFGVSFFLKKKVDKENTLETDQ